MKKLDIFDFLFINIFFGILINSFWVLAEIMFTGKRNPNYIDSIVFIFFIILLEIIFSCFGKVEISFYIPNKILFSLWDSELKINFKPSKQNYNNETLYRFLKFRLYIKK